MVELKRKHLAAEDSKSNTSNDSDLLGEDDWVVVKKQRINILIPPLPSVEQSTVPDHEQGQPHENALRSITTNTQPDLPKEKIHEEHLAECNDGSISRSQKSNTQSGTRNCSPADNEAANPKPRKPDFKKLTVEDQSKASRAFSEGQNNLLKFNKTSPKLGTPSMHSGLSGVCHLSHSFINLDRHMRALNLERKISSAGGLDRWLSSLGLEQFMGILAAKSLNKFYLANLSMKKLKDMGACAVGPRRKLIHAIECVCQPYFCQPLKNQKY